MFASETIRFVNVGFASIELNARVLIIQFSLVRGYPPVRDEFNMEFKFFNIQVLLRLWPSYKCDRYKGYQVEG